MCLAHRGSMSLATGTTKNLTTADMAIDVQHLTKRFGKVAAVDDLSFQVYPGEVFAFLGPNGAGKSTAISMLCTLVSPSSGSARVAGFDIRTEADAVRAHIGLVFQESTLDKQLTAEENLSFHAVLYHVPASRRQERIAAALHLVALTDRRKDLVSTFSGGMVRRLEIARAMLHTPRVLFLDEPTLGLDPQTRAKIWEGIMRLRSEEGMTVFLTTHYMDEAEVADRIGIIDHGRIIVEGTPDELKAAAGSQHVRLHTEDDARAIDALCSAGFDAVAGDGYVIVATTDAETLIPRLINTAGAGVLSVSIHVPTLDDAFLHFTGREIRDQPSPDNAGPPPGWRSRA